MVIIQRERPVNRQRSPIAAGPKIPAENAVSLADNFCQKEQNRKIAI